MNNTIFGYGDLISYSLVEYYATEDGNVGGHISEIIGLFLGFKSKKDLEVAKVYLFVEGRTSLVAIHNITLLSRNEK